MIYKIIESLNNDLNNDVGPNSSYSEYKVENIQKNLPEDITFNRFIGIIKRNRLPETYEIGQRMPKTTAYYIDIAIVIKSLDYDTGDKILGKIERRVLKSLSNTGSDHLRALTVNEDGVREEVLKVQLNRTVYDSGIMKNENKSIHLSVVTVKVTTQLKID